jgi:polyisoprenoid-binding protein YceI
MHPPETPRNIRAQFATRAPLATCMLLTAVLLANPSTVLADVYELAWSGADVEVTFELGATAHTVRGTAPVSAGALQVDLDTKEVQGTVRVDAAEISTGSKSRDHEMHDEVLEIDAHPLISFTSSSYSGVIAADGPSEILLQGSFALHGEEHEISIPVRLSAKTGQLGASADFEVPYVDWGLHDPSILFLRVAKTVSVHVELSGSVTAVPATIEEGTL